MPLTSPVFTPRAYTATGSVVDTGTIVIDLPEPVDPDRSRLEVGIGTTPLAVLAGSYRWLSVYPFDCSEQISSELLPLIALYRAVSAGGLQLPGLTPEWARAEIGKGVAVLTGRQRPDGAIGLWSAEDWSTPWLSAYAGEALLAARDAGVDLRDSVLVRLGNYLYRSAHQRETIMAPIAAWYSDLRVVLAEQVAAADFLSRLGRPDLPTENELLRQLLQGKDLVEVKLVFACPDEAPACMSQAGKSLGATKLVFGNVKQAGNDYQVTLKMLDVNRAFEVAVRRDPANWFWVHDRWKPPVRSPESTVQAASTAL